MLESMDSGISRASVNIKNKIMEKRMSVQAIAREVAQRVEAFKSNEELAINEAANLRMTLKIYMKNIIFYYLFHCFINKKFFFSFETKWSMFQRFIHSIKSSTSETFTKIYQIWYCWKSKSPINFNLNFLWPFNYYYLFGHNYYYLAIFKIFVFIRMFYLFYLLVIWTDNCKFKFDFYIVFC